MTPEPNRDRADSARWVRFYDEVFSMHVGSAAAPDALIGGLAEEGFELVVDARPTNTDAVKMKADCDQAGLYYVPATPVEDISAQSISRYANLALRHKTCVVIDENARELFSAIAAERSLKPTSLDTRVIPPASTHQDDGADTQHSAPEEA